MDLKRLIQFIKKHWYILLVVFIIETPIIWRIVDYLYQQRIAERAAKIRNLECRIREGRIPIEGKAFGNKLLEGDGRFEWQWAGQNWIGYITFKENREGQVEAKIDVHKIFKRQRDGEQTFVTGPLVFRSIEGERGNVVLHNDYVELKNLTVTKNHFGWIQTTPNTEIEGITVDSTSIEILNSDLYPITAFAGRVRYNNPVTGKVCEGDMVLVRYGFRIYPSE
jgi:hypothetical protein